MPPRPPRRRAGAAELPGRGAGGRRPGRRLGGGPVSSRRGQQLGGAAAPTSAAGPAAQRRRSPQPSSRQRQPGTSASEQAILNKVEPGLVIINTTLQYNSEAAAGTGMVISAGGRVLTNNHVIEDATKITATALATGKHLPGKVVGYDVTGDIALMQLQGASGLHTVPIGDSATVKTGAPVVAMGNAEGQSEIVPAAGQVTGAEPDHHRERRGRHGHLGDPARHDRDERGRRVRRLRRPAGQLRGRGHRHGHRGQRRGLLPAANGHRVRDPDQHRPGRRPSDRRGAGQFHRHDRLPALHRDLHRQGVEQQPAGSGRAAAAEHERRVRRLRHRPGTARYRDRHRRQRQLLHQRRQPGRAVLDRLGELGHPRPRHDLRQPRHGRGPDRRVGHHRGERPPRSAPRTA